MVFSMHKFEVMYPPQRKTNPKPAPHVKVSMISQIDLGREDNSAVYQGMLRAMSITALKKNIVQFHQCWCGFMDQQIVHEQNRNTAAQEL